MAFYNRRQPSAVFDAFTLSPLPYPALLVMLLVFFLLGASWLFSFQDFVEELGEQLRWEFLAVPVVIVLFIRWLSSVGSFQDFVYDVWPHDWRRWKYRYDHPSEDSTSPWSMAALLVVLLVLAYFQSDLHGMWGP